jgi:Peptidase propeptide and YPEB domain
MSRRRTIGMAVGAAALGVALLGAGYGVRQGGAQHPAYTSSVRVQDQNRDEGSEGQEAAQLQSLAKIDMTQATSAALAQVPGTVLRASLDNENGNVVYSVEVKTTTNEVKDVKVDAGNGTVVQVGAAGNGEEGEGNE